MVTPDGAPWARVDNAMVKALARAFRWRKMLGTASTRRWSTWRGRKAPPFGAFSGLVQGASGTLGFLSSFFRARGRSAHSPSPSTMITGPAVNDDVVTSPATIPLPAAGALHLLALGGLGLLSRVSRPA